MVVSNVALAVDGGPGGFPPAPELRAWLEALELQALVPGRCSQAPDARAFRSALHGIRIPAVRALFCPDAGLTSSEVFLAHQDPARRSNSLHAVLASAHQAAALGASWLVLDLQVERLEDMDQVTAADAAGSHLPPIRLPFSVAQELDVICRSLHQVLRKGLPVGVALATPPATDSRPSLQDLGSILEDLARHPLGYWHDSGRAHAREKSGHEPAGDWLDQLGASCVGADLTDAVGTLCGLPAGAGEVDLLPVREALPSNAVRVIRSEPFVGPGPLAAALRHLRGLNL